MVLMLTQGPIPVQVLVSIVFVAFGRDVNVAVSGSVGMTVGGTDVIVLVGIGSPTSVLQEEVVANSKDTTKNRSRLRFAVV